MAADNELPVWTIRPNWLNGVLERLEWLTDVIGSTYGTEQRRALRLSPRRSFEMTFNPIDEARSYFDLWLHRLGSSEFMVPLFHDRGKLAANVSAAQDTIPVDTTYREFVAGGMAVILGDDPFTFDVLEITDVAAGQLTINPLGLGRAWGKGTAIYPLRRTRISQESLFAAITNRVGEASLQFELNQANDIPDEGAWALSYNGLPILLDKPNRRERLEVTYSRNSLLLDNEVGLRHLLDDAGRAFTVQTYGRMMRGRAEHWAFRQMLYRLRGQAVPCWLPSFNRDFTLARSHLAANAFIDVRKIGYAYTGGAISGRRHVLFNTAAPLAREIINTGAPLSAAEERLMLSGALGTALTKGTTGSFLEITRLATDAVEITHHTDTDGVAECNLSFRGFRDERTIGTTISYPIPITGQNNAPCGTASSFLLVNPGFEEGATGWSGAAPISVTGTSNGQLPAEGVRCVRAASGSYNEFYQDLSILPAYYDEVDAGQATLTNVSAYHCKYASQTDHGALFVAFLNAAKQQISRVQTAWNYTNTWTLLSIPPTAVPAGTRYVRIGAANDRDEGTENNNNWDGFSQPVLELS